MKKLILAAFTLALMLNLRCVAQAEEFSFVIESDNSYVNIGDSVNISLAIINNSGLSYELFSMQDYVCFDAEFLSLDTGSIKVLENAVGKEVFQASALIFGGSTYNRIYINRASLSGMVLEHETVVLTFKLTAVKPGVVSITNDSIVLTKHNLSQYSTVGVDTTINIGGVALTVNDVNIVDGQDGNKSIAVTLDANNYCVNDLQGVLWIGIYCDGKLVDVSFEDFIAKNNSSTQSQLHTLQVGVKNDLTLKAFFWTKSDMLPITTHFIRKD